VVPEWAPDHEVTAERAARVVAEHAPHLAGLPVRRLDAGWDNTVFVVGEEWLFRFVHRAVALPGARRELSVLGRLAGMDPPLPLAVPVPRVVGSAPAAGADAAATPWPFWGAHLVPGVELAAAGLPDAARTGVAAALGAFLRALHGPDLARWGAEAGLPVDPIRRADAAGRVVPLARERLDRLAAAGVRPPEARVVDLLDRAAALGPAQGHVVLVHGDLHVRHVLVDRGVATGVIDWGDTALADPCVDLMVGWAAFSGPARAAFLAAYGPVPADRALRARALAVGVSAALAEQAAHDGLTELLAEALAAIRRAAD